MILAIETSCDETAAAVVEKSGDSVHVLSSVVSSQIKLHAKWGGVVPNLAAREHTKNIIPVIEAALLEAETSIDDMDAIAVTGGPGLAPALQIGIAAAKTLSYLSHKPLLPIHHIEGHIYANFIREPATDNKQQMTRNGKPVEGQSTDYKLLTKDYSLKALDSKVAFPLLALVVSGGHTELILMRDHFEYEILGETEDDAAGEAFDKVARMLGLPYPGGPEIAKRTDAVISSPPKAAHSFSFPRPLLDSRDYRFSFSGLKTAVLYFLKKHSEEEQHDEAFITAVCREFQNAVVEVLVSKTRHALEEYQPKTVIIAGGVSANISLRTAMSAMVEQDFPNTKFLMPPFKYSLDNAAMIAAAAAFRWNQSTEIQRKELLTTWKTLRADPTMKLRNTLH